MEGCLISRATRFEDEWLFCLLDEAYEQLPSVSFISIKCRLKRSQNLPSVERTINVVSSPWGLSLSTGWSEQTKKNGTLSGAVLIFS
jgi:hypothetical protein